MFQCAITCGSISLYSISFFQLQPKYECQRTYGVDYDPMALDEGWFDCIAEDFCGKPDIKHRVIEDAPESLHNWIEEYDMTCAPHYEFGLFGSLFFAAVVVGSLIFPPLADRIGRKPVTLGGVILVSLAQTAFCFSGSLRMSYFLYFLMGLAMPMRVFVGYIFAMEFLPLHNTQLATALTLGFDGLGLAFASLWFMYVNKDWKSFFWAGNVFCYCTILVIWLTMSESPKFLISRGRYDEAREVI